MSTVVLQAKYVYNIPSTEIPDNTNADACCRAIAVEEEDPGTATLQAKLASPHRLGLEELFRLLRTSINGLDHDVREEIAQTAPPNVMKPSKGRPTLYYFIKSQFEFFSGLLWFCCAVCVCIYIYTEVVGIAGYEYNLCIAICIAFLNVVSGLLSFAQHVRSRRQIRQFEDLLLQRCVIIVGGAEYEIDVRELIVGDVIRLKAGQNCPADVRLAEQNGLRVSLAQFTGESEPLSRDCGQSDYEEVLRATNMVFSGCPIMSGTATGIVTATGDNTELGKYRHSVEAVRTIRSPLQCEVRRLVLAVTVFSLTVGLVFFACGLVVGLGALESFAFAIGLVTANVPEGLGLALTVSLQQAAARLGKKRVLVKALSDVETLGGVSVICSDKTGTITTGIMSVATIAPVPVPCGCGSAPADVLTVLAINSTASILEDETVLGDPSETAIMHYILQNAPNLAEARSHYPQLYIAPFNSHNKYQLTANRFSATEALVTMKGAIERVVRFCANAANNTGICPITDVQDQIIRDFETAAAQGQRVLGVACKVVPLDDVNDLPNTSHETLTGFTFLGFVTLIDPPKERVREAIEYCNSASIQVVMITGDNYLTASAIAKYTGIFTELKPDLYVDPGEILENAFQGQNDVRLMKKGCSCKISPYTQLISKIVHSKPSFEICNPASISAVMTGEFLEKISATDILIFLNTYRQIVFARTTPYQKLQIVYAFQSLNKIVAASGDGLNDAPALKYANVGISMVSGSDIAKDAARVVIMDNNFASIVDGVYEGRLIYDNIYKCISYALTTTVPEMLPFLFFIVFGFPHMLSPITIILIDLATNIWPSFALGYEVPEADIMKRPPRSRKERLFSLRLAYHSYIRIGVYQLLVMVLSFMYGVCFQYRYFTGHAMPLRAFANTSHLDFQNVRLAELLRLHYDDIRFTESYYSIPRVAEAILNYGQTSAFASMVMMYVAHAVVARTKTMSVFHVGLCSNWRVVISAIATLVMGLLVIYLPFVQSFMGLQSVHSIFWAVAAPFCVFMFVYSELRKAIVRCYARRSKPSGLMGF